MAVLAGLVALVLWLVHYHPHIDKTQPIPAPLLLLGELFQLGPILLAMWVMARREHRTFAEYGLPWRRLFAAPLWAGALAGIAALAIVVGAMIVSGAAHIAGFTTTGAGALLSAAAWAAVFLTVGVVEESFFRGYPQFTLGAGFGYWPAAVALSLLFGLLHSFNPGESLIGKSEVVIFGLFMCVALWRFGDLRWGIGFHAAWDWGQTYLFGVGDSGVHGAGALLHTEVAGPILLSGGSAGPEATIFTPVMLGAIALGLVLSRPRRQTAQAMDR
jgi:membrane protease YdiL (CAAX protease family)